jgi:dTDP-glucose 4,6-dehydratase
VSDLSEGIPRCVVGTKEEAQSMRCLITGGNGFVGAHMVRHVLEATNWDVVSLDRLDEAANHSALAPLVAKYGRRIEPVWRDLRSPIVLTHKDPLYDTFDYVLHLAAASHVTRSILSPLGFLHDNVMGTAHLLEWARFSQPALRKLLLFSTDECYGPAQPGHAYTEDSPFCPNNPYAASKAAAEMLVPAWANTWGLPLVVTRATNIYGAGQHPEKFIPLVVDAVERDAVVQIHARNGVVSSRYYVHVDDVCRGALTALLRGATWSGRGSGAYNISGDEELSNLDVAQAIAGEIGRPLRFELCESAPNRPKHDQRYALDGTRLRELDWKPEIRFADGLPDVVESLRRPGRKVA